jgi:predicted permease
MVTLLLAMLLVLVVASANAGNLVLGRVLTRVEDLRLRAALGASRLRLVLSAACEPLLLTIFGVALGLAVGAMLLGMVTRLDAGHLPRLADAGLDVRAVLFALLIGAGVAVVVGAAQAGFVLRLRLTSPGTTARTVGRGGAARRTRDVLAVVQLGLAAALLIGSTLVARSFIALRAVDPGFDAEGVLALTVVLSWNRVSTLEERSAFTATLLERLRALPGVTDAGMVNSLPLSGSNSTSSFTLPSLASQEPRAAALRGVSPGYARTLRIPVRGREFTDEDLARDARTALVNEAFVRRFLGDREPIGERIALQDGALVVEIVGVVGDIRHYGLAESARPEMYLPYTRETLSSKTYVVRTRGAPLALAPEVRRVLDDVDPDQPIRDLELLESVIARSIAVPRFNAAAMTLLAVLAVVLAAVGLFAVLSALVAERLRELAVRMTLGAGRTSIVGWVLGRTARLALPGALLGWLVARWAGRALESQIAGVTLNGSATVALALGAFLAIALLASLAPAARAGGTDPARVLRDDN